MYSLWLRDVEKDIANRMRLNKFESMKNILSIIIWIIRRYVVSQETVTLEINLIGKARHEKTKLHLRMCKKD